MSGYFRWVFRQAYLVLFLPKGLEREHPDLMGAKVLQALKPRLRYLLGLLPWTAIVVGPAILLVGIFWERNGGQFFWPEARAGAAIGIGGSLLVGACFGVSIGISQMFIIGIALSANLGIGAGPIGAVIMGSAYGLLCGITRPIGPAILCTLAVALGGSVLSTMTSGAYAAMFGLVCYAASFAVGFPLTVLRLTDYPLYLALDWICLVRIRLEPENMGRWWRRHPLAWNDTIRLPLPKAGAVLATLVRHDRKFGFQTIAWVAAEREHQRGSIHAALTEVILDDLEVRDAAQFGAVPTILGWLDGPSFGLRGEWTEIIPGFIRTAHYVSQGLALKGRFRQLESLEKAIRETSSLRKALIGQSDSVSAKLLSRANEWASLIETFRTEIRHRAKEECEIPQVFRFGNPVREEEGYLFAGRQEIVQSLESALLGDRHPPSILLHGARRMGKTSILLQLRRLLGPEIAPATVDCQSPGVSHDIPSLFAGIVRAVLRALHNQRQLPPPLDSTSLGINPFPDFDAWLQGIEARMPANFRILICLDEYEALARHLPESQIGLLLDYFRHLQQHRPRINLLFSGLRSFRALGSTWTSRLVNSRAIRVSFLTFEEFHPILVRPIPEFNLLYLPGALESLVKMTAGQPFLTQAVAMELVDHLNRERRQSASEADVRMAASAAIRSADTYFADVWDQIGTDGRALVRTVLAGLGEPKTSPAFSRLVDLDVLSPRGELAVPMMRDWITSNPNEPD